MVAAYTRKRALCIGYGALQGFLSQNSIGRCMTVRVRTRLISGWPSALEVASTRTQGAAGRVRASRCAFVLALPIELGA